MPLSATASGCGSQNKSNPISSSFQNKILPQTSIFHNESLIYNKHKNQPIDNICQHHLSHELLVIAVWFFELKELICKSSNCLNMSFMEWIIWSSPNFSGMGFYRVDCIPSTLHTLFFFFHFSIFSWSQLPFVFKRNPFLQAKLCIWVVSDISIKPRCDSQFLDSDAYIFYDSQVALC